MKKIIGTILGLIVSLGVLQSAYASGVQFKNDDGDYMKLGGRIQLQYHWLDPENGERSDSLFFRRLRPYIEGSVHKNWKGKFQWDMGKSGISLKDAYFQFKGFKPVSLGVGNMMFPFSREMIISSKYQQLVERTFVGNHNYGTPDRQTGIHAKGDLMEKKVSWSASLAMAAHDPDNNKIDFESVIQLGAGSDWSQGPMGGANIDWYPLGAFKAKQGDFDRKLKVVVGAAGFGWKNDGDNLDDTRSKKDLDRVGAAEGHFGFRGYGISLDAQYNYFNAQLMESGIAGGLYEDSKTVLTSMAVEGGYMVLPAVLEIVGGYQTQQADGYEATWSAVSVGLNYFVLKHDVKFQLNYQMGRNKNGVDGNNINELFVQTQYVF